MRVFVLVLLSSIAALRAEPVYLKPADFKPLTSLPWKDAKAPLDATLDAIYREPDIQVRYPVLALFLWTIPTSELGEAFDDCIKREGTVLPDDLVSFFLGIWAARDPEACWVRMRALFHVVGPEYDYLTYDSWTQRPVITISDLAAVRASPFWLDARALGSFPEGVDNSALPRKERVRIMREFVSKWFDDFGTWPGSGSGGESPHLATADHLMEAFSSPVEELKSSLARPNYFNAEAARQIAARRLLVANPSDAPAIIKEYREMKVFPSGGGTIPPDDEELIPVLMLWAGIDQPAMVRWVGSLDVKKDYIARVAMGLLMPRVDAETRERWLASAKAADKNLETYQSLLYEWKGWEPRAAIAAAAAVATRNAEIIEEMGESVMDGPFAGWPHNSLGLAMEAVKEFHFENIDPALRTQLMHEEWEVTMEEWGEIDPGGSARYGVDIILRADYVPKDKLEQFFAGDDIYPDEEGMLDRTFCALRSWAVFKPDEMAAWIKTLNDPGLEKSLTWLMYHPWGTKPKPGHEL
jgi:hypothetical protein